MIEIYKQSTPRNVNPLIRIVCATKVSLSEFGNTLLGKSLWAHDQLFDLEIHVATLNSDGLPLVYNRAIEASVNDPAVLVFVHDDVYISDWFWAHTVVNGLTKWDVVGLAGTTRRHPGQVLWCWQDAEVTRFEDKEYLSGSVAHGMGAPPANVSRYGTVGKTCVLMDGLFLACDSRTMASTGLRFDPRFQFHFYDLDFCRQAEMLNLTMGTVPISVVHNETMKTEYNPGWHQSREDYLAKWNE